MKKVLLSALVACVFSVSTVGCWGSFALTKKAYDFNDSFWGNKWISWVAYLVIGSWVGMITIFFDALIFNSLEWWTSSNPIAVGDTFKQTDAEGNTVTAVKMDDGSLFMRLEAKNGETQELVVQQDKEIVRLLDTKGNVLKETAYAE